MIYRSYIYSNYSFSLLADFKLKLRTGTVSRNSVDSGGNGGSKGLGRLVDFLVLMNELYYQSLYYFSAIIIIGCSYRWSMIGLLIIVLSCMALFRGFNRRLVSLILLLNLLFLFVNYLVLLLNNYQIVVDTIGQHTLDRINYIALLIGFNLDTGVSSYTRLFILNIVIFYFCVVCYKLAHALSLPNFPDGHLRASHLSNRSGYSEADDHISFREPTVMDTDLSD
jgi:hypothetical protein